MKKLTCALLVLSFVPWCRALDDSQFGLFIQPSWMLFQENFNVQVEKTGFFLKRYDDSRTLPALALDAGVRLWNSSLKGSYNTTSGFSRKDSDDSYWRYWLDYYYPFHQQDDLHFGVKYSTFKKELSADDLFDYQAERKNLALLASFGTMDFDLMVSTREEVEQGEPESGGFVTAALGIGQYENNFEVTERGSPLDEFRTENDLGFLFGFYAGGIAREEKYYLAGSMGAEIVTNGDATVNGEKLTEADQVNNISGLFYGEAGYNLGRSATVGLAWTWRTEKTDTAQKLGAGANPDYELNNATIHTFLTQVFLKIAF